MVFKSDSFLGQITVRFWIINYYLLILSFSYSNLVFGKSHLMLYHTMMNICCNNIFGLLYLSSFPLKTFYHLIKISQIGLRIQKLFLWLDNSWILLMWLQNCSLFRNIDTIQNFSSILVLQRRCTYKCSDLAHRVTFHLAGAICEFLVFKWLTMYFHKCHNIFKLQRYSTSTVPQLQALTFHYSNSKVWQ